MAFMENTMYMALLNLPTPFWVKSNYALKRQQNFYITEVSFLATRLQKKVTTGYRKAHLQRSGSSIHGTKTPEN